MERLKAAVIGCGRMGAYTRPELAERLPSLWLPLNHAEALLAVEGVDLIAVCDTDREAARQASARWRVGSVFSDYRALIDEIRPTY